MKTLRTPLNYSLNAKDLFWLISESPRGEFILDEWHGHATARELAAVLWDVDPDTKIDAHGFGMHGLAPTTWVAEVLDYEATSCPRGGSGRIERRGDDYVVPVSTRDGWSASELEIGGGRPYRLPTWPKN